MQWAHDQTCCRVPLRQNAAPEEKQASRVTDSCPHYVDTVRACPLPAPTDYRYPSSFRHWRAPAGRAGLIEDNGHRYRHRCAQASFHGAPRSRTSYNSVVLWRSSRLCARLTVLVSFPGVAAPGFAQSSTLTMPRAPPLLFRHTR
jgi:hypothetical protein